MEVRRAVRQLYVKSSTPGSNSKEWHHAMDGGLRREPANQDSLPGPCGGQLLHLHPKQGQEGTSQPHLPKARVRDLAQCMSQEDEFQSGNMHTVEGRCGSTVQEKVSSGDNREQACMQQENRSLSICLSRHER